MNSNDVKKLIESYGVSVDCVASNEVITEGLSWSYFIQLVSFLKENGISEEKMRQYNPVSGYIAGPMSRYKLGIETIDELKEKLDSCTRELHIRCELFCDLESQSESKESALTRILELLNQNGISISINRAEIHLVEE